MIIPHILMYREKKTELTKMDKNEYIRFQKMTSSTIEKAEFLKNETSCTLPLNYPIELTGECSTSHIQLVLAVNRQPGFRQKDS